MCVIGALALTAGAAGAATTTSGLRGVVYSTGGGACLEGSQCNAKRPLADMTLVFSRPGHTGTRTTVTRDDGSFRVALAPGTYGVRLAGVPVRRKVTPTSATVTKGQFRSLTFIVAGPKIP